MERHPKFKDVLDAAASAPKHLQRLAFQVYLDLLLAKDWDVVNLQYVEAIDKIVLRGKRELQALFLNQSFRYCAQEEEHLMIPMDTDELWSVNSLKEWFSKLSAINEPPRAPERYENPNIGIDGGTGFDRRHFANHLRVLPVSFVMSVVSSDSTVVYYHMHRGLVAPSE
ncbi:tRNA intron endonuclease [Blyttiomyces helicus]|uniref:tRNA intron endonuclease n=1 Tax=Blyttiomyces helicus TaxID=388810 RepID=A0A4P9VU57_9FUNG|nr:tRNA intron endonuclease [Blyttiomyces helicus]|eukprot:RKO83099.1 tRNA intron endonuclease [Blyttiomyces helicus]